MLNLHKGFSRSVVPALRFPLARKASKVSILPSIEDRLSLSWKGEQDLSSPDGSPIRAICAVGFSARDLADLRTVVGSVGILPLSVKPIAQMNACADCFDESTHVIVNLDAFEAVEDAIECLLNFRSVKPACIVIAVSVYVLGDDLGSDRRAICDATLRWPISMSRFDSGLRAAEEASACDFVTRSAAFSPSQDPACGATKKPISV